MTATKRGISLAILVVGSAATLLVLQHQAQARLRAELQALRQQVAELQVDNENLSNRLARAKGMHSTHLPLPHAPVGVAPTEPTDASRPVDAPGCSNLLAGFPGLKAKAPNKLSAEQLEGFLNAKGRTATRLLAAYRTTGDPSLLQEAMQRFHGDPQVALQAVLSKDASPEERRQWLETFKQSDPGNSVPNYLSALDYFKAGQTDQALQELALASDKPQFEDYAQHRSAEDEQAYLAAGYSMAEAKAIAPLQQALDFASRDREEIDAIFPLYQKQTAQFGQTKALCQNLVELAKSYQQSGDSASAQSALQMAATLGQRYSGLPGENGLGRLVGGAAEVLALAHMAPDTPYGNEGQTVQDRISELRQQRTQIKALYSQATPLLGMMSDQDWAAYSDCARVFGEPAALQWVVGKYGQK
jgi:hypothetical protein